MLKDQKWVKIVPLNEAVTTLKEAGVPLPLKVIRRNLTVCVRLDGVPFVEWEDLVQTAAEWGVGVAEFVIRRLKKKAFEIDLVAYYSTRWKEQSAYRDARREWDAWRWIPKPIEIDFDEWLRCIFA